MAAVVTLSRSFTRRFVSYKWTTSTTCIVGQNTSRLTAKHFGSRDLSTSPILQSSAGKHWLSERGVSVALLALIPAGLMYPTPIIDYSIALILPLHIHWGINSVITDYVPRSIAPAGRLLLIALSLTTVGGLLYMTYSDVGICNAIRMIWSLN